LSRFVFEIPAQTTARAAYIAAALNLAAGIAMATLLEPGLPSLHSVLRDRMAYVTIRPFSWWGGWLTWHAAALSLLAFYAGLASRWGRGAPMRATLAMICALAGFASDIVGEAAFMGIVPHQAEQGFFFGEQAAGMITGYAANGLYTVAGILLTWIGSRELPRWLVGVSAIPWGAGLALCAASLENSITGQARAAMVLMPSFVIWVALVGRWLSTLAS
jgi:hypothetical protein